MPLELPEREPCPFCENLQGSVTWESPDVSFGKDAVLIPFAERSRLAKRIAEHLPSAA